MGLVNKKHCFIIITINYYFHVIEKNSPQEQKHRLHLTVKQLSWEIFTPS